MTVCNMTIEGGGRAGHDRARRDHLRLVRRRSERPGAPRGAELDEAIEQLARAAHRRRAPSSTARSSIDAARDLAAGDLGHEPRDGARRHRERARARGVRQPRRPRGDRARARTTWTCSPARRSRRSRSTASSSAPARTRASATCAPPPRSSRAARSPRASTRWSCPAPSRSRRRPRPRASTRSSATAGFDWRVAGCSMCLGMNPDILAPGRALRLDLEPQLRGPPGARRAHAPRLPADGRRGRDRGALRRHPQTGAEEADMEPISRSSAGRASATSTAPTSTPTRSCPSSSSSASSARASASSSSTTGPRSPAGICRANPILVAGRELRLRLLARARAVGPAGLRLPGARRAELRRHLLLQLHQDRAAAGRALRARTAARSRTPGEGEVDLREQEVRFAGREVAFEIDHEIRRRLLDGLDDIGVTLEQAARDRRVRARARAHRWVPTPTTAL